MAGGNPYHDGKGKFTTAGGTRNTSAQVRAIDAAAARAFQKLHGVKPGGNKPATRGPTAGYDHNKAIARAVALARTFKGK